VSVANGNDALGVLRRSTLVRYQNNRMPVAVQSLQRFHHCNAGCGKCGEFLFEYQKDGPGILKRLYLDRIRKELKQKNLTCPNCKQLLGIATIYKKENRPAYRLFAGALVKSR
jgi:ribosomal protein S27AE